MPYPVGSFEFEVLGSGRSGRHTSSKFSLRCNAIGIHGMEILLLSVAGPETSIKALLAGLRSSGPIQKHVEYAAHVGDVNATYLNRCEDGYRIYRSRLGYGLWHVLCLAKRDGFMPVLSEAALWQRLQGSQFTTPLIHEWTPWLYRTMMDRSLIVQLTESGCEAGVLVADSDALDDVVSEGIRKAQLSINGRMGVRGQEPAINSAVENLDQYMLAYGTILGKQAEQTLEPLHVPVRDSLPKLELLREPFDAQSHVIEATRKALARQKALLLVGEMGVGKTMIGMAAIHAHAAGKPYRALVFCPGQLVKKWEREIRETLPDVEVIQIESWKSLLHLNRAKKPGCMQWYIIARDRAKLGARWQPAFHRRKHLDDGFLRCPHCGLRLVTEDREPLVAGKPAKEGHPGTGLWKRRQKCEWVLRNDRSDSEDAGLKEGCGCPLWQMNGELRRYEPAMYIKRHLRRFFDYLVLDEVHEEKGADTAQGHAAGALAASCRKVIALTGTLIGGYAEHLRPLLFRLSPGSLVHEGLGWSNATAFNERYGRIETRITEKSASQSEGNRMSRGSKTTVKSVRPGIMPSLFGRHLIDKAVFLSLCEVADNLPPLEEECIPVTMDAELEAAYRQKVEKPLIEAIKEMMKRGDRRLLGAMLQTLLAYPDHPFNWPPIGYFNEGHFVTVATPPELPDDMIRPKEQALIDLVRSEKDKGRKVWVYVIFTDKHDVEGRLEGLFLRSGLKVGVLRSNVSLVHREEWIARNAPGLDVLISHPRLVETGLDLFDKKGSYNFPTIAFYESGYSLFTLRQASRRSWRIGQRESCRVLYLYYAGTMQDRAMALMAKKLTAAKALEGSFSTEGLVALAGDDANVELALARSLVERMDEGDARRMWNKVVNMPSVRTEPKLAPLPFEIEPIPAIQPVRRRRPRRAICGDDSFPVGARMLF